MARIMQLFSLVLLGHVCMIWISTDGARTNTSHCLLLQRSEGLFADCRHLRLTNVPQTLPSELIELDLSANQITTLHNSSFRTLPHLQTLRINGNGLHTIESDAFSPLLHLLQLFVINNKLVHLHNNTFAKNIYLEVVIFGFNNFESLPANLFLSQPFLSQLHFMHNRIEEVNFHGIASSNLTSVDLSGNYISSLRAEDFYPLCNAYIRTMDLAKNEFTVLPHSAFKFLTHVVSLDLDTNKIQIFNIKDFLGMSRLTILTLRLNNITAINVTEDEPINIPPLLNLFLPENKLTIMPSKSLRMLSSLRLLDLSDNRIRILMNDSFYGLSSLQTLNLKGNQLKSLDQNLFDSLPMLEIIILSFNRLTVLNLDHFQTAFALKYLHLDGNNIANIESSTWQQNSISTLDLSSNNIEQISKPVFDAVRNLTELNLSKNPLTTLKNNAFTGLECLQTLFLCNIQFLSQLFTPFETLRQLTVLKLDHTGMPLAMNRFVGLGSLRQLALRSASLINVNLWDPNRNMSVFGPLSDLRDLQLGSNSINGLYPRTFEALGSLQILDLSKCGITSLPNFIFQNLSSLRTLVLHDNKLTMFSSHLLTSLKALTDLDINNNGITEFNTDVLRENMAVTFLDLANNALTVIKQDTILPRLTYLDVSGNPLSCTCELAWFLNWLDINNLSLRNVNKTFCGPSSTRSYVGLPLQSFHPAEICSPHYALIISISLVASLFLFLTVVAYHKRWWINYKCYLLKLMVIGYKEVYDANENVDFEFDINIFFHDADEDWVQGVLKEGIAEHLPHLNRIVCGDNDLPLGGYYLDVVDSVIENSYKTVAVVSRAAVACHGFIQKLLLSIMHMNEVQLEKIILVFVEDIPDSDLPYTVRLFLSANKPYFLWTDDIYGQRLFWEKLKKHMRNNKQMNAILPL